MQVNLVLQNLIDKYIEEHQGWSQERVIQSALSLFLMQNGTSNAEVNSLYLDSLYLDIMFEGKS